MHDHCSVLVRSVEALHPLLFISSESHFPQPPETGRIKKKFPLYHYDTPAVKSCAATTSKMRLSVFTVGVFACLLAVVAAWSKEGTFPPLTYHLLLPDLSRRVQS